MKNKKIIIIIGAVILAVALCATIIVCIMSKDNITGTGTIENLSGESKYKIAEEYGEKINSSNEVVAVESVNENEMCVYYKDGQNNQTFRFINSNGKETFDASFADEYTERAVTYIKSRLDTEFKDYKLFVTLRVEPTKDEKLTASTSAEEFLKSDNVTTTIYVVFQNDNKSDKQPNIIEEKLSDLKVRGGVYYVSDLAYIEDITYIGSYNATYNFNIGYEEETETSEVYEPETTVTEKNK